MAIASAQFTIVDLTDVNISFTEPLASERVHEMLWLDTSVVPNRLKKWDAGLGKWEETQPTELEQLIPEVDDIGSTTPPTNASSMPLWKYQGTTYIDGGNIWTNTITANAIAAGTITANEIASGTITADSGIISDISADTIKTGTLDSDIVTITGSNNITLDSTGIYTANSSFIIDSDGNVTLVGKVTANSGAIGGWSLADSALYSGGENLSGANVVIKSGTIPAIALGTGANAMTIDGTQPGFMVDGSGKFRYYISTTDYIRMTNSKLDIKSSSFSLSSGNMLLDTNKLKFGTVTSATDTSKSGVWISGDGAMLISSSSTNFIKKTTTDLEIQSSNFLFQGGTEALGQLNINPNSIALGKPLPTLTTGSGFYVGQDGKMMVGNATGARLQWDGTDLKIYGTTGLAVTLGTTNKIAGWTITETALSSNGIEINSTGSLKGNYTSGVKGWNINSLGDAEFNNATIRGSLRSSVLEYGEVMATSGSIWVVPAAGKALENFTTSSSFDIKVTDPDGIAHATAGTLWASQDIVRIKEHLVGDFWGKITNVQDKNNYWLITVSRQYPTNQNFSFTKGVSILNYKSSGGMIQMTADEATAPYMQMGAHKGTPWNNSTTGTESRLRIGNLNSIGGYTNNVYGMIAGNDISKLGTTSFSGFSLEDVSGLRLFNTDILLYNQSVKSIEITRDGKIIAGTDTDIAGMTGTPGTVRIWAGATYDNRNKAPFRVYQDGTVTIADTKEHDRVYLGNYEAETIVARNPTSASRVYCDYASLSVGDKIYNETKDKESIVTFVSPDHEYFDISPSISEQTSGNIIIAKPYGLNVIQGRVSADVIIGGARSASFVIADGSTTPKRGIDRADYIVPVGSQTAEQIINQAILDLPEITLLTGTAAGVGNNTITLNSSAAAVQDEYTSYTIKIIGGTGQGQVRTIVAYDENRVAQVDSNWSPKPNTSSTYAITSRVGKIILLEGTFTTSTSVKLTSNTEISGQGAGTIIRFMNSANGDAFTNINTSSGNQNIFINSLQIDGNKESGTSNQRAVYLKNSFNCKISDTIIHSMRTGGIEIDNNTQDGSNIISSNFLYNNGVNNNGGGIKINGSNNDAVTGNTIEYSGYGVSIESSTGTNCQNNMVVSCNGTGIYIGNSSHIGVVGNTYNGLTGTGDGVRIEDSEHSTVQSNTVINSRVGLAIIGSSSNMVSNNRVNDSQSHGLLIGNSALKNSQDNSITNNIINGAQLQSTPDAANVFVTDTSSGNFVFGNILRGSAKYGVWLSSNAGGNTVSSNDIYDAFTTKIYNLNNTNVIVGNKTSASTVVGSWKATDNNTISYDGTVKATTFDGNATTSSKWSSPITLALTGGVTAPATNLDGSTNLSIATTLENHTHSATAGDGGQLSITGATTGTLTVARGGTGTTSFTAGRVLFGNGTSAIGSSDSLFWNNTTSKLGIGTATPNFGLDMNDDIRMRTDKTIQFGGTGATDSEAWISYNTSTKSMSFNFV